MASTIGKVRAVFTASSSGLTAGVNQASASMKRLERDVRGLRGGLSTLTAISGTQLFGSIASGAMSAARSLIGMASASVDAIGNQRDLAARLGLTYGELSGLTLAGEQVGVSMDTIGAAVTRAEVAFTKAAAGSSTARAAFDRIGLSVEELNGMSAAERFQAIAQAISELPTPAERSAAAVALFGRAGAQLLPMFEQGAAGIQAAMQEADAFGLALNSVQATNVDAMGDAFTRAQAAVKGVVDQVVAYLAPAVTAVTEAFLTLIKGVGGQNIGAAIGEGILQAAIYFAGVADFFISNVSQVWGGGSAIAEQWSAAFDIGLRTAKFLAAAGEGIKAAFGFLILGISGPIEGLIYAAKQIGDAMFLDTSSLDTALQSMDAFNQEIIAGFEQNAADAASMFGQVWDEAPASAFGEAAAGPVRRTIEQSIAAAREAMGQLDSAQRQTVDVKATVDARGLAEAVKGVDSRTSEGMKEYFRLMRGEDTRGIQERIAAASERIADNTEDMDVEMDVFDLAPAAGT